jgi:acyl transferase domain-containing protein
VLVPLRFCLFAACSSSLVSLHMAFNAMLLGNVSRATNSGANLMLSETVTVAFRKSGMLAADGRCKTLDTAADGYVRAEAAGSMLLELVQGAKLQQQAPQTAALLLGSAVNQDGRSSGLTAPNGPAQQEVMRSALATAGVASSSVSAVQMHGTGTPLGDPIEVGALAAVMLAPTGSAAPHQLVLMAGKSLIGHSEPAAGVMGLVHAHVGVASSAALPLLHLKSGNEAALCFVKCSRKLVFSGLALRLGVPSLLSTNDCVLFVSLFASCLQLILTWLPSYSKARAGGACLARQARCWRRQLSAA